MRVLVTSSKDFIDVGWVDETLDSMHAKVPITAIIATDNPGAGKLAGLWAKRNNLPALVFPVQRNGLFANLHIHGSNAVLQQHMQILEESNPNLILAFSYDRRTAALMSLAKKVGVNVKEMSSKPDKNFQE